MKLVFFKSIKKILFLSVMIQASSFYAPVQNDTCLPCCLQMEYWMASNETGHHGREETIQEVLRDPGSAVLFIGYPRWLLHFAAGCCILFMLIGIPGNLFTIAALFRTKKVRVCTFSFSDFKLRDSHFLL